MMESNNLQNELIQAINTHLDLCDPKDTPIICGMLEDPEARQKVIDLAIKKIINQKIDVPTAILEINNEFDPNYVD